MNKRISIDNLIEIVRTGGKVKTGVDVYNDKGILLLGKNIVIEKIKILEIVKKSGINSVPVNTAMNGGLWDGDGNLINIGSDDDVSDHKLANETIAQPVIEQPLTKAAIPSPGSDGVNKRLHEIEEIKQEAIQKFNAAKISVKKVLTDIRNTGGEFDFNEVQGDVSELVDFLITNNNPFAFLTQEILSYDDYLYNHSIHVCTIGTAIVNRFNKHFSKVVDDLLKGNSSDIFNPFAKENDKNNSSYMCYYPEDLNDISLGFFLHDIGKILVADEVLNKNGKLTAQEFREVQRHSYEYGAQIIDKNKIENSTIKNIIKYHHAPLYSGEKRCYPDDKSHTQIPLYTRICKLADIYDAMTSKRCYKEAINPIAVVTTLFRDYAKKDRMLQYVLHSFVKSIGIYPPGSIVYLRTGQMAYVLESAGPIVLPFTDNQANTLKNKPDPINIGARDVKKEQKVDSRKSVKRPKDVYEILPSFIKTIIT